ncbi:hypothetical protein [Comamonas sp.]|uniref:hypothetical protein n=1 Tax=Comamonas sp. TaxID=34028 RepID=UPI00289FDC77|nr:hypothetical protein [Comamonas sp.]
MARNANTPAQPVTDVVLNPTSVATIEANQDALALLEQETETKVRAIALQVGYEGALTVGALEDGIRFYQRRTVESILETGKRLLLLRELSQNGTEFDQRAELLGFARSTAYRFMKAASKAASSAPLSALVTQVKSASAFLELVTHDDDTLESLKDMDDIDRMSASELRATLRQAKEDNKFMAEKRDKEMQRADKAEKALKNGPKTRPLSERLATFAADVDKASNAASEALIQLGQHIKALEQWWLEEAVQLPDYDPEVATPMPPEVLAVAQKLHDSTQSMALAVGHLQHDVRLVFGDEIDLSRTHLLQSDAAAQAE